MNISNNTFTNLRTKYTPPLTDEGKQGEEASSAKEENLPPELAMDASFKKLPGGLMVYVEELGKGEKVETGSKLSVHYEGWRASDFTKFDSSIDKGRPFEYNHGEGMVIKGWEKSMEGMRVGTKLQLKIPAKLAYGPSGMSGAGIPPNTDLIFKLEILAAEKPVEDSKKSPNSVDLYA